MTQHQLILNYLKEVKKTFNEDGLKRGWVYGFNLPKKRTSNGRIGTEGQRRARELRERGLIDYAKDGRYVIYKAL